MSKAKMVHWNATGAGVVWAFAVASQTPCRTTEEFESAAACRTALRDAKTARKDDFDAVTKIDPFVDDEAFEDAMAHLDGQTVKVILPPAAFRWLRAGIETQQVSAAFAESRLRLNASLAAAREEVFDVVAQENP